MRALPALFLIVLGSIVPVGILRYVWRLPHAGGAWERGHVVLAAVAVALEVAIVVAALVMRRRPRLAEWCAAGTFAAQAVAAWLLLQADRAAAGLLP